MNYVTSKDYEKLWSLVQEGKEIVCFSKGLSVSVSIAKKNGKHSDVFSIGIPYVSAKTKRNFMRQCEVASLSFIPPDNWIKIEKPEDVPPAERLLFYNCQDKTVMEGILSYSCVYSAEPAISIKAFSHYKPLPEPPRE